MFKNILFNSLSLSLQILFDFELRYGTNSNELLNNWSKYIQFIEEISNEAGGQSFEDPFEWAIDVLPFLNLLKLLPSTAAGRETKKAKISQQLNKFRRGNLLKKKIAFTISYLILNLYCSYTHRSKSIKLDLSSQLL